MYLCRSKNSKLQKELQCKNYASKLGSIQDAKCQFHYLRVSKVCFRVNRPWHFPYLQFAFIVTNGDSSTSEKKEIFYCPFPNR